VVLAVRHLGSQAGDLSPQPRTADLMASVVNDPDEFQGFARAAIAELGASQTPDGSPSNRWEYHLRRAAIFAQLETAHQLDLLRKEGLGTYVALRPRRSQPRATPDG